MRSASRVKVQSTPYSMRRVVVPCCGVINPMIMNDMVNVSGDNCGILTFGGEVDRLERLI